MYHESALLMDSWTERQSNLSLCANKVNAGSSRNDRVTAERMNNVFECIPPTCHKIWPYGQMGYESYNEEKA
jgi:hypothetical protein